MGENSPNTAFEGRAVNEYFRCSTKILPKKVSRSLLLVSNVQVILNSSPGKTFTGGSKLDNGINTLIYSVKENE